MWLLHSDKKTRTHSDCPRRFPYRPRLEVLEDRSLLSAGGLDTTFGSGGIVTTNVGQPAWVGEQVDAVALQPDGKIIAVGVVSTGTFKGGYNKNDTGVVRYNTDGSLDNTFSGDGKTITSFGANIESHPTDVAVQYDGKLVVSGHTGFFSYEGDFAVVRYNANGSLDTTFGGKAQGIVTTDISKNSGDSATAMELQTDHKIVLAGYTRPQNSTASDIALVRYNLDGSLDTTFSGDGKVTTHLSFNTSAKAMAIYASPSPNAGKILVLADAGTVVRYLPNGNLDPTFGGGAGYVTPLAGLAGGLAIQADDGIVVSLRSGNNGDINLIRLQPNGALDSTFGTAGITQPLLANSHGNGSVTIQPDGKIVVGWSEYFYDDGTQDKFAVARFNTNGSLDDSFGVGGIATSTGVIVSNFGGMAMQTDGKIVVGGRAGLTTTDFALARFLGDDHPVAILTASVSEPAVGQTLSRDQVAQLISEAFARRQTALITGPEIGSFAASLNSVIFGISETLTAANVTAPNSCGNVVQVAFYFDSNGAGKVETGTDALLDLATQTRPDAWTFHFAINLEPGAHTLFAQSEGSYGVFGDPFEITLTTN